MNLMRSTKAQAAIDFMTSYGFILLVLAVIIYLVLQLGVFNYALAPQYCYSTSSFSCLSYTINANNGTLTMLIAQTDGGTIVINGAACSTSQNSIAVLPLYGNGVANTVHPDKGTYASFYPANSPLSNSITAYPANSVVINMYCYNAGYNLQGAPATGQLGKIFTGYVWLNYTYANLPNTRPQVQQVFSVSARYT